MATDDVSLLAAPVCSAAEFDFDSAGGRYDIRDASYVAGESFIKTYSAPSEASCCCLEMLNRALLLP